MNEIRKIDMEDLRNLCIKNKWYTCGNGAEYDKMLSMCEKDNITTEDIVNIAQDIMQHSNDDRDLSGYCFEIARIAVSFFEEIGE